MVKLQMFWKFQLFCWTLLAVTGNEFELEESQVFIYYQHLIDQFDLPDCLGTLITAKYALTGASCFIKKISNVDFRDSVVVMVIIFICRL